jgi:hypothetical protein
METISPARTRQNAQDLYNRTGKNLYKRLMHAKSICVIMYGGG